jgi:hypothetical protein
MTLLALILATIRSVAIISSCAKGALSFAARASNVDLLLSPYTSGKRIMHSTLTRGFDACSTWAEFVVPITIVAGLWAVAIRRSTVSHTP